MYPSYVKSIWSISLTVRDSFPIRSPSVPDEGSAMLTNKQHELLCFIHRKLEETGVSPSFEEMKEALDLKSKSRSEEHTSELQSLMRILYAVFCLKKIILTNKHYQYSSTI